MKRFATRVLQAGRSRPGVMLATGLVVGGGGGVYCYTKLNRSVPDSRSTTPLDTKIGLRYATERDQEIAFEQIIQIVGKGNATRDAESLLSHSDSTWQTHHARPDQRPGLVAFPDSTEQVSAIMKVAHKHRLPIVPYSGGTSLEGHYTPEFKGGVCLDMTRMSEILTINPDDMDVVVQPGVGWEELNEVVGEKHGLMFGPDPGPGAMIGGMIGTSCSGTNAYRYLTMRENVINLTVVLADGTVIKTRNRPRKSSAGYNLTQLFIGSEGTLGIVTEATLKLVPKPQNESVAVVTFDTVADACRTVAQLLKQSGLSLGAIELMDETMMHGVNKSKMTTKQWAEKPSLFLKFNGLSEPAVREMVQVVESLAKTHGSQTFEFAADLEERESLWSARRAALWSTINLAPENYNAWTTDVAVPISKLAENVVAAKHDLADAGLIGTVLGHVGDGNFHAIIMYDPETDQHQTVKTLVGKMIHRAMESDGTCTGEHGVGIGKRDYLQHELGQDAIDAMRHLKLAFDPQCILNPGKVVQVK